MKIKFLGVGAAFSFDNYQSNMLIDSNNKKLLIDAGGDIRFSRKKQGLSYRDIDAVYISHLHADHIGGMEYLAFSIYFDPNYKKEKGKMKLFANSKVIDQLWESMKAGVKSIQGKLLNLEDYFDVQRVSPNGNFIFSNTKYQLVQTVHIMDGYEIVPSYGLLFQAINGKRIFITTDTQFAPKQIETFYADSDVIFHDCETSKFPSGVHAHYNDLKTLDKNHKGKMWLYHYQDGEKPDAKKDDFAGFIEQGQEFDFSVKGH